MSQSHSRCRPCARTGESAARLDSAKHRTELNRFTYVVRSHDTGTGRDRAGRRLKRRHEQFFGRPLEDGVDETLAARGDEDGITERSEVAEPLEYLEIGSRVLAELESGIDDERVARDPFRQGPFRFLPQRVDDFAQGIIVAILGRPNVELTLEVHHDETRSVTCDDAREAFVGEAAAIVDEMRAGVERCFGDLTFERIDR